MKRTVSFSKQSKNIFFHILTTCNLSCKYCYINKDQHGYDSLSLATIESWLQILSKDPENTNLIFLGGEPTLHPDLARVVKTADKMGFGSITIDTNGYLFHDILSRVTPLEVDCFNFSLDGSRPETNDRIRGNGSFEACIAGISAAKEKGFGTSLIYTVNRENIFDLDGMISLLKMLGVDRFFIQVIGLRGRFLKMKTSRNRREALQVAAEDWLQIVPRVAKKIAENGIPVMYPKVFLAPEDTFECAGLVADNYFIFPNGRVYRCPLCEDYPMNSMVFTENGIKKTDAINETDLFVLNIPEGCVMNRVVQPGNIIYHEDSTPKYRIACCMLKEEILPTRSY